MNGESLFPTTSEPVVVPNKRVEAEKKALRILNMFATPGNKEVEYQGDEGMPRTSEDGDITGQNNSTLGKILATIKKLPPIPYNITSSSVEEFKDKLTDELVDAGLLNDIVDVTSNIDKLVNEQLAGLSEEAPESVKEVSSNQKVNEDKTVEQVAEEIEKCTGVAPASTVMNGEELTGLPVTHKPSVTKEGNPNKFNGRNKDK
jgi:polyhydroxyalkanoate synthesis regulator phasin